MKKPDPIKKLTPSGYKILPRSTPKGYYPVSFTEASPGTGTTPKKLYPIPLTKRLQTSLPVRKDYRQVSPIEKTTDKSRCTPYPEKLW